MNGDLQESVPENESENEDEKRREEEAPSLGRALTCREWNEYAGKIYLVPL